MKINNFDNLYFIFFLCIFIIIVNVISSINFFSIMFLGILFLGFSFTLRKKYYYSLTAILLTFAFIELNNGFNIFSLMVLAAFVNIFLVPNINRIFSIDGISNYIHMTVFYISTLIMWSISSDFNPAIITIFTINLIIDFLIFGLFI